MDDAIYAMASILPIMLSGDNLGQRHRQLNFLVNEAYHNGISLASIRDMPEKSALDRLFKIDLASKYKDVSFIIENLKHEDMLFVSKALKCTWLLEAEYRDIIKPSYLEDVLYHEMTTTAVAKMKHWIDIHLRDPKRNEEFYQFYRVKTNIDESLKFFFKCSQEFVLREINKELLERLEPRHLKLLVEKCPDLAKVYFENLEKNELIKKKYLQNESKYYDAIKLLLKINGDEFLNITEKYFNSNTFRRFNSDATKYIMKTYKNRFVNKPELYVYSLLDIKTLAKHLSVSEIKDFIVKLAQASYLQHWFSYKQVEPLLRRLSIEERTPFKKIVFVDKAFGDMVEEWPYETPSSPTLNSTEISVFKDDVHYPDEYDFEADDCCYAFRCKRSIRKKKGYWTEIAEARRKTSLDQLFDRYRFVGFEKTLFDLRKQLNVETAPHRQNIMLVLISKSGGRVESLEELLKLLTTRHENEPDNLRATVIRSLVRRCNAWRLPQNVWERLLKFGRGIGLNGNPSKVACKEGIHAVIIRNIILDQDVNPAVWKAFIEDFSTLNEYSLVASEKEKISTRLPEMLMTAAKNEPKHAIALLEKALDTLDAYKIRVDKWPSLVKAISDSAHKNKDAEKLILRLFNARIARKELFVDNFAVIQNNASYYNALKHNINILALGEEFEALIKSNKLAHDKFITTMSLYFNEENGLSSNYLTILKKHINNEMLSKKKIARYIAILSGEPFVDIIQEFNDAPKNSGFRRFAAALRANCHLTRPLLNLHAFDWKKLGAKAISNRIMKCSTKHVEPNIQLLMTWSRTQKLALIQSMRIGKEVSILQTLGENRPKLALKIMLQYLKTKKLDPSVWNIIIEIIMLLNTRDKINDSLRKALLNVEIVPDNKKANYCMSVFKLFRNITGNNENAGLSVLCNVEQILSKIDTNFITDIILRFLDKDFTIKKVSEKNYSLDQCVCLHFRITAKSLLLCKSYKEQETKWNNLGKPFFDHFEVVWNSCEDKTNLTDYLDEFFQSLKYTKVFLDTEYVSCLPMFERIINRLESVLPIHSYFEKYICLHLTMLYFKSIRQSMKNNNTVFDNLPENVNQAAQIVGRIFGKLIARDIAELIEKYFHSILEIYKDQLKEYLRINFNSHESWKILVLNIAKGILEHENSRIHILAVHILLPSNVYNWPVKEYEEICKTLNESKNMEVLIYIEKRI